MTATMKVTNLQNESSLTPNIVLNADGTTTIAGTTATALTTSGNLTFTGTGNRITGDFSNATVASRVAFQTSTVNGATQVNLLPNGTSIDARIIAYENAADPANSSFAAFGVVNNEYRMSAGATGTSTFRPITFYTGGSERLRLDTSGNLGLGVTPSAWSSAFKGLEIAGGTFTCSSNANILLFQNAYFNGTSYIYNRNNYATYYRQQDGEHRFYNAPSGTAGNAISFTQAMTLDASGNLGIGVTTPDAGVHLRVFGNAYYTAQYGTGNKARFGADATGALAEAVGAIPLVFYTNNTERARLLSSGNFVIGSTTSNSKLYVVDGADRTEATSQFAITGNAYTAYHWLDATAYYIGQNSNSRDLRMYAGSTPTTGVKLTPGATAWASTSDEREKDIIEPIVDAANKLSGLRAIIGKYKTDDEGTRRSFLIAQDVKNALPEAVSEDANGMLSLRYTDVIPLLTAAIQEQQAIITQLQADVAALKGAA